MSETLHQRDGFEEDASHPLVSALSELATRHSLQGCVLISFYGDRVGVNSCAETEIFGQAMEKLGDRILVKIDDGEFDDIPAALARAKGAS